MNYKTFFQKSSIIFSILFLPLVSYAYLVPCGFYAGDECHLSDLITLVENVIQFALFYLAAPLAVLSIAIGGLLMITARGDTGQLQRGKDIFYNTVIGFVVAFGAWLIVEAIVTGLGTEGTALTKIREFLNF